MIYGKQKNLEGTPLPGYEFDMIIIIKQKYTLIDIITGTSKRIKNMTEKTSHTIPRNTYIVFMSVLYDLYVGTYSYFLIAFRLYSITSRFMKHLVGESLRKRKRER